MGYRLVFDAGWAEATLAAAGFVLFLALWPALRRLPRVLIALRVAASLLILGALLKPALQRWEDQFSRPRLTIVLDRGPSMRAEDDRSESRLSRSVQWLLKHKEALAERADVVLMGASGGARRIAFDELKSLDYSQQALEPQSVFSDILHGGAPSSRLWLLSDGTFDSSESLSEILDRLNTPIDVLGVGPKRLKRSLSVAGIRSPDFVFIHRRFDVSVSMEANQLEGGELKVRLWQGSAQLGENTARVKNAFDLVETTFTVTASALGRQNYRLEITGASPDAPGSKVETTREFGVEVIRQKYRIMYLAGRPSFEYSHLRAHLKEDPNHELVSFVILRNPENVSPVGDQELSLIPFPASEIFVKNLFEFDLFILENFAYWRFNLPVSYLQNLKRFVSQGGALLVIGGSNAFTKGGYQGTPLEETLPVTLWSSAEDFKPGLFEPVVSAPDNPLLQLGATKSDTEELWSALPPLDGFSRFASVRSGSSVLLSHPTEKTASGSPLPVVAVREYGKGKVMLVGTDSTWRWKLGGGQNWKIASFYGRFWSRAVQYLTGSLELKKVKFSPLPDRMPSREPAILTVNVFDQHFRPIPGNDLDLRLVWTRPNKKGQHTPPYFEREPGVFQIELTDLEEGRHRLRAVVSYRGQLWGEDEVSFQWERNKGASPLNRKRLKSLADQTGGEYSDLESSDLDAWLARLPPVRKKETVLSRDAVWSWSGWLWAAGLLLLLEWFLRRRWGYL